MILELILIVLTATVCATRYIGGDLSSAAPILIAALVLFTLAHLIGRPMRWQLYPVHLLTAALLVATFTNFELSGFPRHLAALASMICILVGAMLALGFPTIRLPAPAGPHEVGFTSAMLERQPETATHRRQLALSIWYPAQPAAQPAEPLWQEFQQPGVAPAPVKFLTGYLRYARTHSVRNAPAAPAPPDGFPVLIYSHGAISIAGETTLLMEDLASAGYVVIASRHTGQAEEMRAVSEAIPEAERARDQSLNRQVMAATSREERASLSAQLFDNSTGMPKVIDARAGDVRHIIDSLTAPDPWLTDIAPKLSVNVKRIGALGLSLGGAVSFKACSDLRCRAAANLDGGLFGAKSESQPAIPHLMLYSAANAGTNDELLATSSPAYNEAFLPDSKHLDLHDITAIAPILRWTGLLGRISASDAVALRNRTVRTFFDENLKP